MKATLGLALFATACFVAGCGGASSSIGTSQPAAAVVNPLTGTYAVTVTNTAKTGSAITKIASTGAISSVMLGGNQTTWYLVTGQLTANGQFSGTVSENGIHPKVYKGGLTKTASGFNGVLTAPVVGTAPTLELKAVHIAVDPK